MPIAIDTRILQDSPMLALAIAAEHLIEVFHTHGASMEKSEAAKDVGNMLYKYPLKTLWH